MTFSLHRLVSSSNSDRNILHFLNVSHDLFKRIAWRRTFAKLTIRDFLREWEARSEIISRLTIRRNKFFAHYDKEFFYEPDVALADVPFGIEDAIELTRLLQQTLSFFSDATFGHSPLSLEGFVYGAAERLYDTLRNARDR